MIVLHCSVCTKPQFWTPSGMTCEEGHGGADPIEELNFEQKTAIRWIGEEHHIRMKGIETKTRKERPSFRMAF